MTLQHTQQHNHSPPQSSLYTPEILLTEDNFNIWAPVMKLKLRTANLGHVIEGKSENEDEILKTMVLLLTSIEKELMKSIHETNPMMIWISLEERFSPKNQIAIHNLRRELYNCRQRPQESVLTFAIRLRTIFGKFMAINQPLEQVEKANAFIHGLND